MYANLEPAPARGRFALLFCMFVLVTLTVGASAQPTGISFGTPTTLPSPSLPPHDFYQDSLKLLSNESYPNLIRLVDGGNTIRVYINDGNAGGTPGTFSNFVDTPTGTTFVSIKTGDFNNDGRLDAIGTDFNNNDVAIFLGLGNGKFAPPKFFPTGGFDPIDVCLADFNRSGNLGVAVANHFDQTLSVLNGDGKGNLIQGSIIPFQGVPQSVQCGHLFNGSLFQDVVITTPAGSSLLFFPGNGDGTFGTPKTISTGPNPAGVAPLILGDTDALTRLVLMNSPLTSSPLISGLTVSPPTLQSTPISGPVAGFAIGDFTGTGGQQIVTLGPNGLGAGNFGQGMVTNFTGVLNSPSIISSGTPAYVGVWDMNGDAHLDMEWTDPLTGKTVVLPGTGFNPPILTPGSAVNPNATTANVPLKLQTGWYYDNALNGTGIFIEEGGKSGNGLFMGEFGYDASGNSLWYVSTGQMHGANYTSTWLKETGGQTLTGAYTSPTGTSIGNVTLSFTDSAHITMTRPGTTPVNFSRFTFTSSPVPVPPEAGTPQIGWWWAGSAFSGTGYGIEIQNNAVFIVAFVYDTNGNPVWYLATGALSSPTSYSGTWQLYTGGPQLTSPEGKWAAHSVTGSDVPMMLTFSDTTHGTLTMGNVVVPIVRFQEF